MFYLLLTTLWCGRDMGLTLIKGEKWTDLIKLESGGWEGQWCLPKWAAKSSCSSPSPLRAELPGGLLAWGECSVYPPENTCYTGGREASNHVNFRTGWDEADFTGTRGDAVVSQGAFPSLHFISMAALNVFLTSAYQRGFLSARNLLEIMFKGPCLKQVFIVMTATS